MATRIAISVPDRGADAAAVEAAVAEALAVFHEVDRTCTRFDPRSDLMALNASPDRWHTVPSPLYDALVEALRAYDATSHRFDPRVLRQLVALGYCRTQQFGGDPLELTDAPPRRAGGARRWRPSFRPSTREVRVGPDPVDLGGIGKGLAVRWAAARLARATDDFLVDAGGDCFCAGRGPDADEWRVGIEDPNAPGEHLAVLGVRDRAVATSSVRLRRWRAGGQLVHHLIDPRTGLSGGQGLLAVSVVGRDPATAEVWSKTLFLEGAAGIRAAAERRHLAALWVGVDGSLQVSAAARRHLRWLR